MPIINGKYPSKTVALIGIELGLYVDYRVLVIQKIYSKNPPYILIVIRFNVNRFQCYSMLIQKNIATIFSRSLEFCSWKMWSTADIAGIYLLHPL